MWPSLETTPKTITVDGDIVFITLGTLNHLDLHFEGAGNGPDNMPKLNCSKEYIFMNKYFRTLIAAYIF